MPLRLHPPPLASLKPPRIRTGQYCFPSQTPAARVRTALGNRSFVRHSSNAQTRQSAISWTPVATCIAVGATVGLATAVYRAFADQSRVESWDNAAAEASSTGTTMSPSIPPGRPGSLTPEEETRLRELWSLMLQVFGVLEPVPPSTPQGKSPQLSRVNSAISGGERTKKNRLSFLKKRRETDSDSISIVSTPSTPGSVASIADTIKDDKHSLAQAFKNAIADTSPSDIRDGFWSMVKHDHPDALLLRFLRARKWDVNAALVMAISALHWRIVDAKVDSDIMPKGEEGMLNWASSTGDARETKEGEDFMSQIRAGKSFLHGRDKEGRPICYVRVRLHIPGKECEASLERFTVYTIETARLYLKPPIDTATIIFDMSDFGMKNMDYIPVKFIIKCFEANYPESLGAVLVHKAPWVFNQIWRIIKGWLDPVVASKVHFTSSTSDLEQYIDKSSILKELGGANPWTYTYVEPKAGENAALKDEITRNKLEAERAELLKDYETTVMDWVATSTLRPSTATSTTLKPAELAADNRRRRDELAAQLEKNYWALDPYVRARGIYDRTGELQAEGAPVTYDLDQKVGVAPAPVDTPALAAEKQTNGETGGRPSVDSLAQSFYTVRENWD